MPTARKSKPIARRSNPARFAAAKPTARTAVRRSKQIDWNQSVVTTGGGVAATIDVIRRTRGPNKKPTKEQVAIRFDKEILFAFRSGGAGWQTRMNTALKEWLAAQPQRRKGSRTQTGT